MARKKEIVTPVSEEPTKKVRFQDLDERTQIAALRVVKISEARKKIIPFAELMFPSPVNPDDVRLSRYVAAYHHRVIAERLEMVERGEISRLILNTPPRMGKSELVSRSLMAWAMGRRPESQLMMVTYNQEYAESWGKKFRDWLQHPAYRQIFPGTTLDKHNKSSGSIGTEQGGLAVFAGVQGGVTGKGADLLIIDDPIKNAEEAGSQTTRDKVWEAFQSDLKTRLMPGGRIVIMHTRWHPDDMVGRLIDPENDYYDEQEAAKWHVVKLPALLTDPNTGEKEAIPLWPEMEVDGRLFGWNRDYFIDIKRQNARTYWALYQQEPTVEDGDYFKREWFKYYTEKEKPHGLRIYASSDHAISSKQGSDYTVLCVVGVDEDDNIYVLDIDQRRMDAEAQVDSMLLAMKRWKPITWFAEKGHITQSIGPFLRKRMLETKTYINIQEMTPVKDKVTRSQSFRARMSMGKVFFPKGAHWVRDVEAELLKFPNSTHDDIVDSLSWIGIGLGQLVGPSIAKDNIVYPKTGTLAWARWNTDQERKYLERKKASGGL